MTGRAVLAISSRVVRGHVGNSAAAFTLQRLGLEVYEVPTLVWNHHPGHGRPRGIVLSADDLSGLLERVCAPPWASEIGWVTSGYLADASQVGPIAAAIAALKTVNPGVRYVCDPVCGDAGGRYVSDAVVTALRDRLVPLADYLTPNRFELALLTGREHADTGALAEAARALTPGCTLITSAFASDASAIGNLLVAAGSLYLIETPRRPRAPHGTGDLMTALFVARLARGATAADAATHAAAAVGDVIAHTTHEADELALIAAQDCLIAPRTDAMVRAL